MAAEDRISEAFARIEEELLDSLMRNMERHQAEETAEGFDWPQWQALQMAELSSYTRRNAHRNGPRFDRLNARIDQAIRDAYETGRADEEARLLEAVRQGWEPPREQGFFHAPSERLDALVNATRNDMLRAEYAILRKAEDDYRETIMDAAIYGTSGAGTYAQAIDMATRDFVRKGVTGITYRNGSQHSIVEYSRMAVRTATKRAALVAEGDMRREWGVHTVFVNYREDACPDCMVWQGQVLVDDVYSGGTAEEARDGGWPLLSEAMAQGLFHPNCKDTSSTYFEGITELPKEPTRAEIAEAEDRERLEGRLSEAEAKRREYERLHRFTMDPEASERYGRLEFDWEERAAQAQEELENRPNSVANRMAWEAGLVRAGLSTEPKPFEVEHIDFSKVMERGNIDREEAKKPVAEARAVFEAAVSKEPAITSDVTDAVRGANGGMSGLDFRLKQPSSLAGKIAADAFTDGVTYQEAASGIKDAVRFTAVFEQDGFTEGYRAVRAALEAKGYAEVRCKNFYTMYRDGKGDQKAVQCVYRTPDGYLFEFQFHTPESLGVKEPMLHPLYEEWRAASTSEERREELSRQMKEITEAVPVPEGVYGIDSYSRL